MSIADFNSTLHFIEWGRKIVNNQRKNRRIITSLLALNAWLKERICGEKWIFSIFYLVLRNTKKNLFSHFRAFQSNAREKRFQQPKQNFISSEPLSLSDCEWQKEDLSFFVCRGSGSFLALFITRVGQHRQPKLRVGKLSKQLKVIMSGLEFTHLLLINSSSSAFSVTDPTIIHLCFPFMKLMNFRFNGPLSKTFLRA